MKRPAASAAAEAALMPNYKIKHIGKIKMYYIISLIIYISSLLFLVFLFKKYKNEKIPGKREEEKYVADVLKELNISHIKSRKKRMKALPLSDRILYRLWSLTTIALIIIVPAAIYLTQSFVIKWLYVPEDAIFFRTNEIVLTVSLLSGAFLGAPIACGFSYLTYSENIKRAAALDRGLTFQPYSKIGNIILCFLTILIAVPVLVMCYNNYTYCTDEVIVKKPVLAFSENRYSYYDVELIEQETYSDGKVEYAARMKTGEKITIYFGKEEDSKYARIFKAHNLKVEEVWNIDTA